MRLYLMNKKLVRKHREVLERLYRLYNRRELVGTDPLEFVYRYSDPADMEIVALLSADLAYGRVRQIQKSLTDLLGRMGDSPYEFVRDFDGRKRTKLMNFKHRFTTGDDIADLLSLLKTVLNRHRSIENFFMTFYDPAEPNIVGMLGRFCDCLCAMHARQHDGDVGRGIKYLLAGPSRGGACKRLNLFLRWMVRKDDVDPGLWSSIDRAKLIVPLDVHMSRLCRILRLCGSKTASLKTAIRITDAFAEIEPADPVKYDFAMSRVGIVDGCDGHRRAECEVCELVTLCRSV